MAAPQQSKRKSSAESDSPRKHARLNGAQSSSLRPQSSSISAAQKRSKRAMADAEDDLNLMSPAERQLYYEDIFANKTERLHTLAFPSDLTDEYPHLTEEINAAYLRHTIFTVDVWMNYDPAAQRFFNDEERARDCGKLILPVTGKRKRKRGDDDGDQPRGARERLQHLEFGRVRFELCTPFTRLGRVLVQVEQDDSPPSQKQAKREDDELRLKPTKKGFYNPDDLLKGGMRHVATRIDEDFLPQGRAGLNLGDLDVVAGMCRLRPGEEGLTWAGWARDTGVWMNFLRREERNWEGYVEGLED